LIGIVTGAAGLDPCDIFSAALVTAANKRLGQPVVVESRPGAGTNIATEAAVRAPADGYTLLMVGTAQAINATLYNKLNFHFIRDITPVVGLIRFPV
jgi:tripartite-type tricarboxylate transporter receptor subunit TctC